MNHSLLIRIGALLVLLSSRVFTVDDPVRRPNIKVRVVCGIDVPNPFRSTPTPNQIQTYFDVSMPLQTFADDIAPQAFLEAVAEKTSYYYPREWIGFLSILRWSAADRKYLRIERLQLKDTKEFLSKLQEGDVLACHGQACRS